MIIGNGLYSFNCLGSNFVGKNNTGLLAYKMAYAPLKKYKRKTNREFIEEWKLSLKRKNND